MKAVTAFNWVWISFSYKGRNMGVCNVYASSPKNAVGRAHELGLVPALVDDVAYVVLDAPAIEPDTLMTREQLAAIHGGAFVSVRGRGHDQETAHEDMVRNVEAGEVTPITNEKKTEQ